MKNKCSHEDTKARGINGKATAEIAEFAEFAEKIYCFLRTTTVSSVMFVS